MKIAMKIPVTWHTVGTMTKFSEISIASQSDIYGNICFDIAGVASSILATPTIESRGRR
jgi:hypothetical protein